MPPIIKKTYFALPVGVFVLGLVGFLVNISTVMVYSQLPMYLKTELNLGSLEIGFLDGAVELISYVTRIASGGLTDFLRHRKIVLSGGYILAIISKPILVLAGSALWVFIAQSLDRLSNGIQASPRDALVGDISEKRVRGASYGLMRSLRTAGSVVGAVIAISLMTLTNSNFQLVFAFSILPTCLALLLLVWGVKEKRPAKEKKSKYYRITFERLKKLKWYYWRIIFLAGLFELSHFSDSLLTWRAHDAGLDVAKAGFVMVLLNIGQFTVSYPLGVLSDRYNRKIFLAVGFLFMLCANLIFMNFNNVPGVLVGVFLWGAQMGVTQSIFLSMISDNVAKELRGTAFGIFYVVIGISYLVSSIIAGKIWDHSYYYTFALSLSMCVLSLFYMVLFVRRRGFVEEH